LDGAETVDIPSLACAVEEAGRGIPGLPAKTLVAVGIYWEEADLSVVPISEHRVAILPAAGAVSPVECPVSEVPQHVAETLGTFARTGRRRLREVTAEDWAVHSGPVEGSPKLGALSSSLLGRLGDGAGCGSAVPSGLRSPVLLPARVRRSAWSPSPGLTTLGALTHLTLDAPFGRCTVEAFERLIAVAEESDAPELRLSPSRGIVLVPTRPERAATHLAALAADFIIGADDPRRAVATCTGAPACASGTTPTLRDAAHLAAVFAPFAARGLSAHVSGCAKGCARPGPADLTLVGHGGTYGIVLRGSPGDPPTQQLPIEAALERLGRAATLGFAAAFAPAAEDGGRNRRPA
jgi:precorrin-3B synthase